MELWVDICNRRTAANKVKVRQVLCLRPLRIAEGSRRAEGRGEVEFLLPDVVVRSYIMPYQSDTSAWSLIWCNTDPTPHIKVVHL